MKIEVCLSPSLVHLFELEGKNVVVVDILRATSCMVTGLANGIEAIIPVAEVDECRRIQETGLIAAAERDGMKVEGFDLDNSPFSYMDKKLTGQTIVVTTTNGTQAIEKSKKAAEIIIGSFLNLTAVSNLLLETKRDVLIICAGWKGHFNLEDTLFAGALISKLKSETDLDQDSALAALALYEANKKDLIGFVKKSSHVKRLAKLNITKDIEFCVTEDLYNIVPTFVEGKLIASTIETTIN